MITGVVNPDREATIRLKVRGQGGQEQEITAVIDTGFDGFLTLPPALLSLLNCLFLSRGQVRLGDGRTEEMDIFAATVLWDGLARTVETDAANTDPLVGMSLIYGYELNIQAVDGGTVPYVSQ